MDISNVKIGIFNVYVPPVELGLGNTKIYEKAGFDSLWVPDHIMSWFPDAIWDPATVNIANLIKKPHNIYNVFPVMTMIANNTKKVKIGTSVTEIFRHHPALLAHLFITLDHISKGRMILGIGFGEGENIKPYGIEWNKQVSRLEEAIKIIRLLWKEDKKIDFDGKFWKLKDAVLSLRSYRKKKPPPIWIGANGPQMLKLTGKLGDGWLPYNLNPKDYRDALEQIKSSAKHEGRNPDDITPGIVLTTIIDENKDECNRMLNSPLAKNELLLASYKVFQHYGISHPLGDGFRGFYDYIPTKYDKKTIIEALDKIPVKMCEDYFTSGTPEEIIDKVEKYIESGAKHIVFFDYTTTCDLTKMESSTPCLKKVLDYFKGK